MGKNTGSKRTIRPHVIEAVGSHEVWNRRESKPTGGKGPLRPHVIEAGGSTEGWYGEPPGIRTQGPRLKSSKRWIHTGAWFCDGFSVFLAESRRFSVSTDSMGFQEFFPVCRFLAQI